MWVLGPTGADGGVEAPRQHLLSQETKMTIQPKKASSMLTVQATEMHAAGKRQRSSRGHSGGGACCLPCKPGRREGGFRRGVMGMLGGGATERKG